MEEAVMIPEIPQELITYIEENSATPEADIQSVRDNISKEIYKPFSPEKFYVQTYQILKKKKIVSLCMLVLVVVLVTIALFIIPKDNILFNILSGILVFISLPIVVVGGYLFYCVNNVEKRIEDYEMSSARGLLTFEAAQKLYETLENLKKAPLIPEMIEIQNLFYSLRLCTPFEYNFVNNQVEIQNKLNLSISECETKINNVKYNLQNTISEIENIENKIKVLKEEEIQLPKKKKEYEVEHASFENLGSMQKIRELEVNLKAEEETYKQRIANLTEEEKQLLNEKKQDEENIIKKKKTIEECELQIKQLESDYEFELSQKRNKYDKAIENHTALLKKAKESEHTITEQLIRVEHDINKLEADIKFTKEDIELTQIRLQHNTLLDQKLRLTEEKNNLFSPYGDLTKAEEEVEKTKVDFQEIERIKNIKVDQPKSANVVQISRIQNEISILQNKIASGETNFKQVKTKQNSELEYYQNHTKLLKEELAVLQLKQKNIKDLQIEITMLEKELENFPTIETRRNELYVIKGEINSESEKLYQEQANLLSLKTGSEEAIKKVIAIYS